jgi:hypothetical protein
MRKLLLAVMVISLIFSSTGCVTLSRSDQERLNELKSIGLSATEIKKKNPGAAGGLNILPGFGNFYLAIGTEESEQWLVGFLNLLFWPISVVWGIPEAAIDATVINKKETIYYYTYDKYGKAELAKRQAEEAASAVPLAQPPAQPAPAPVQPTSQPQQNVDQPKEGNRGNF